MVHRRASCVLVASFVAALAASLPAQHVMMVPPARALADGTTSTDVPFGRGAATRVQFAYDASLFDGPVTITGIELQLEGADAIGRAVDCEVLLSTLPAPAAQLAPEFARNRSGDAAVVLPRQRLVPPPRGAGGTDTFVPIALATPFQLDPERGGLLLEIIVHGQGRAVCRLAATRPPASPQLPVGPASCPGSNGVALRADSVSPAAVQGRPWTVRVSGASPGAVLLLALGTRESGAWAGLQLPQDLAALGAPGCFLSIDVAGSWYSVAGGDGSAVFPFLLPDVADARGAWLRFQGASFDAAANRLGLVTSRAQKVQLRGAVPVACVWSDGVAAASGTIEPMAAVVRFSVR